MATHLHLAAPRQRSLQHVRAPATPVLQLRHCGEREQDHNVIVTRNGNGITQL